MNDVWRRKHNNELHELYDEPDILNFIKIGRLQWAWHLIRIPDDRPAKEHFNLIQGEVECVEDRVPDVRIT